MSDQQQDPELRGRFAELRRVDASRAPSFADVVARARADGELDSDVLPRRASVVTIRRLRWTGGLAAAAALTALLIIPRARSREDAFEQAVQAFHANPALGAWRSPTDGLLDLPGGTLISTIPRVGTAQQ